MINFLMVLYCLTMLYIAATSRIESYIRALAVQGAVLFFLVMPDFSGLSNWNFLLLSLETLGVKTIILPLFLLRVTRRNGLYRDLTPTISHFVSVVAAGLLFALGFFLAYWARQHASGVQALYFGVAVSTMLTGFWIIITRKMLVTHVIGYLILENGVFLLSLAVAREMPLLVNLGVLLDVFLGIFVLGLFVTKIKTDFDEVHIDGLSDLRD